MGRLAYALFAALFSLNLVSGARGVGLLLSGLLAVFGTMRTLLARRVIEGRNIERDGSRLIQAAGLQSVLFGVYVVYAIWQVRGQVIPECLMLVGVAGLSSVGASLFAPFTGLNWLNVGAQVLPVYVWSVYALPRYGWLLEAFIAIHAVAIVQTIRINGVHLREMFIAQLTLEAQGEELRQARDAADKAASAKMRFLANMSHEIRTPLNGIMGLAEVLGQLDLTRGQREVLDDIGRSGHHLLSIVNDVLDMAKVRVRQTNAGASPVRSPGVNPRSCARRRRLSPRPDNSASFCKRRRICPAGYREIRCAYARWSRICSTTRRSSHHPGKSVSPCKYFVRAGSGSRCRIPESGCRPNNWTGCFRSFIKWIPRRHANSAAAGLGLAISHRLAGLMGGRLWVESRRGEGSTFFFDLPFAAAETTACDSAGEAPGLSALPPGLRVLVAEDNPINQKVIVMMLEQAGARVEIAENGRLAVERHQASAYDMILMDCQMPELDGYAATARIRSLPGSLCLVPIIGVTANAFAEDRERCIRCGMNGYVAKPLSRATLFAAISTLLSPAVKE